MVVPSSKMSSTNATDTLGWSRPRARRATRSAPGAPAKATWYETFFENLSFADREQVGRRGGRQGKMEPQHTIKKATRGHLRRRRRHDCAHTSVEWTQWTQCAVCALWCVCVVHVSRARAVLRSALRLFASRTALGIHSLSHIPPWVVSHGGSKRVEHTSTAA